MFFRWMVLLGLVVASPMAWAQFGMGGKVAASLVSEVEHIQPGEPFWVALKLEMEPHWHTYWRQPGDAGLPTEITWELPEGFTASEFYWPTPKVFLQQNIVNYVYEDTVLLMAEVTPPGDLQPGQRVTLAGEATWLECDPHQCVPGGAEVSLTLPVALGEPEPGPEASAFAATRAQWPQAPAGDWQVTAREQGGEFIVEVLPLGDYGISDPAQVYLFASDGQAVNALPVGVELPEELHGQAVADGQYLQVEPLGEGGVRLRAKVSPYAVSSETFPAVLKYGPGWPPTGAVALAINPVLGAGTAETVPGGEAPGGPSALLPLPLLLFFGWIGGLILNLMPCVFPVIGLKIMGFVSQAGEDRRHIVKHGLIFTGGVLLSFWVLASLMIAFQSTWGFQMQSPGFVLGLAVFFLVFALNLSGVFEIGQGAVGVGSGLTSQQGLRGSFFSGVLAVVVATPCSAPFLATALGATATLPALSVLLIFTAIALGLATPYLVLSAFPALVQQLPRPGAWMETFKQGMAFLLYGTVGYLFWTFAGQVSDELSRDAAIGLAVVGLAAWVYGRWTAPHRKAGVRRVGLGVSLLLLLAFLGHMYFWLGVYERQEALKQQLASGEVPAAEQDFLIWEDWSAEAVAEALEAGQPIYIDFTARWCATCQANKWVYEREAVVEPFLEAGVRMFKADFTRKAPQMAEAIRSYGGNAVPLNILQLPGQEPVVLPAVLTTEALVETLRKGN